MILWILYEVFVADNSILELIPSNLPEFSISFHTYLNQDFLDTSKKKKK